MSHAESTELTAELPAAHARSDANACSCRAIGNRGRRCFWIILVDASQDDAPAEPSAFEVVERQFLSGKRPKAEI